MSRQNTRQSFFENKLLIRGRNGRHMIRKGHNEDLYRIIELMVNTVKVMKREKIDQWDEKYPSLDIIKEDIRAGTLYLFEEDEKKVNGTITIDKREPSEYKGISWRIEGPAYTFHRLAVSPFERGNGIASQLINFAERIAIINNIPYMKVDTYSLNVKAQGLFLRKGYRKVGELYFQGKGHPFYCYDKILSTTITDSDDKVDKYL